MMRADSVNAAAKRSVLIRVCTGHVQELHKVEMHW